MPASLASAILAILQALTAVLALLQRRAEARRVRDTERSRDLGLLEKALDARRRESEALQQADQGESGSHEAPNDPAGRNDAGRNDAGGLRKDRYLRD